MLGCYRTKYPHILDDELQKNNSSENKMRELGNLTILAF